MNVRWERAAIVFLLVLYQTTSGFLIGGPIRRHPQRYHYLTAIHRWHSPGTARHVYIPSSKKLQMSQSDGESDEDLVPIVRGTEQDDLPEEFWQEIEAGKPSEWAVMKEVCAYDDTSRGNERCWK